MSAARKSTKIKPRTRARVEATEPAGANTRSAKHKGTAQIEQLSDDMMLITGQGSELVPVAQYANVTIGPVSIAVKFRAPDLEILRGIDWSDDPEEETEMTDEQRAVFEDIVSCAQVVQRAVDTVVSRDRALVEESVRLYNERQAEEDAKSKSAGRGKR